MNTIWFLTLEIVSSYEIQPTRAGVMIITYTQISSNNLPFLEKKILIFTHYSIIC